MHYKEYVKTTCTNKYIICNGRKDRITAVLLSGQTLCCHVFKWCHFICPSHMALQQGHSYCQVSCHDNGMLVFLRDSTISNNMSQQVLIFRHPETCSKLFCARAHTPTHTHTLTHTHTRDTDVLCQMLCLDICLMVYGHWTD